MTLPFSRRTLLQRRVVNFVIRLPVQPKNILLLSHPYPLPGRPVYPMKLSLRMDHLKSPTLDMFEKEGPVVVRDVEI